MRAVTCYGPAAERGHPLAQYNLAVMLSKGQGCEPDQAKALSWFQKAAARGLKQAHDAIRKMSGDAPKDSAEISAAGRSFVTENSTEPRNPSARDVAGTQQLQPNQLAKPHLQLAPDGGVAKD
jgi:TPR repeat protein